MNLELSFEPILSSSSQDTVTALSEMACTTFSHTFRHYKKDDLETYLRESLSVEALKKELLLEENHFFFVKKNELRVGFLKWTFPGDKYLHSFQSTYRALLLLERFYFLPRYCGLGWGSVALSFVETFARDQAKADALYLSVWEKNFRAQSFYRKHGFQKVGSFEYPVGETLDLEYLLLKEM